MSHELPCPFHRGAICREGPCPLFPEVEKAANALVTYLDELLDDPRSETAMHYFAASINIRKALDPDLCNPDYIL